MRNNLMTVNVDRRFLLVVLAVVLFIGSVWGAYEWGFKEGIQAVLDHLQQQLQGGIQLNDRFFTTPYNYIG